MGRSFLCVILERFWITPLPPAEALSAAEGEESRIPELRNGSQIFKKWSEMVLPCWGFDKNVSRETFLVQENETRMAVT